MLNYEENKGRPTQGKKGMVSKRKVEILFDLGKKGQVVRGRKDLPKISHLRNLSFHQARLSSIKENC